MMTSQLFRHGARCRDLAGAAANQIFDGGAVAVGQHRERIAPGEDILADAVAHEPYADQAHSRFFCHLRLLRVSSLQTIPSFADLIRESDVCRISFPLEVRRSTDQRGRQ